MIKNTNNLRNKIIYRCLYTGTKETDLLFKKYFLDNIDSFSKKDLKLIKELFDELSENEIFNILTKKSIPKNKFKKIFDLIINV